LILGPSFEGFFFYVEWSHPTRSILMNGKLNTAITHYQRPFLAVFLIMLLAILASPTSAEIKTGSWSAAAAMHTARGAHTATLLRDGRVLVTGGYQWENITLQSSELYDPASGTWMSAPDMNVPRSGHLAVLLHDGRVLVMGGWGLNSAELFDPLTNTWTPTADLTIPGCCDTATLLHDGRVLVTDEKKAEIYDPAAETWSETGDLNTARRFHKAVLLNSGEVLVMGGEDARPAMEGSMLAGAELYNPHWETWTPVGDLHTARDNHTATLLPDGRVLVAGGWTGTIHLAGAEIYDPGSETFSPTADLNIARGSARSVLLPNGRVLVAGGIFLDSVEEYDPLSGSWTAAGTMNDPRSDPELLLLGSGQVLVTGGYRDEGALASADLYTPVITGWKAAGAVLQPREGHASTLLQDGQVLVAGGRLVDHKAWEFTNLDSAELYNPATNIWSAAAPLPAAPGTGHTATRLQDGRVLVAGGDRFDGSREKTHPDCLLFDPAAGTWTETGQMIGNLITDPQAWDYGFNWGRAGHSATLLQDGRVLAAGGWMAIPDTFDYLSNTAELFDPTTETWTRTMDMNVQRGNHTATLLPDGRVLLAGGSEEWKYHSTIRSAEIFDPQYGGSWRETASMHVARQDHTATLLADGRVLVTGGHLEDSDPFEEIVHKSAEIYDPVANTWTEIGVMHVARTGHTAALLPDGRVLVSGGSEVNPRSSEIYDPGKGTWTLAPDMIFGAETATLLQNGWVLARGFSSAELYRSDQYDVYQPVVIRP
jgi:N-acetylneuraminic acid mutarotase